MKSKLTEALDATSFRQRGFHVDYDEKNDVLVTITRFTYRFTLGSTDSGFVTGEYPGIASDKTEVFQRSDFEACLRAIREWAERIVDREEAAILDEFGGVADRDPSLKLK
jgi:hypothetical protein